MHGKLGKVKYKTISNLEILQSRIVLRGKRKNSEIISEIIGSLGLPPTSEHHFYILIKLELFSCFVELSWKKNPKNEQRTVPILSLKVTNMLLLFLLHKVLQRKLQLCIKCLFKNRLL